MNGYVGDDAKNAEVLRQRVSGYKRVRRIEFSDLPKTISSKIRRVELRGQEKVRPEEAARETASFWKKT